MKRVVRHHDHAPAMEIGSDRPKDEAGNNPGRLSYLARWSLGVA
jgi:hypothetical protein